MKGGVAPLGALRLTPCPGGRCTVPPHPPQAPITRGGVCSSARAAGLLLLPCRAAVEHCQRLCSLRGARLALHTETLTKCGAKVSEGNWDKKQSWATACSKSRSKLQVRWVKREDFSCSLTFFWCLQGQLMLLLPVIKLCCYGKLCGLSLDAKLLRQSWELMPYGRKSHSAPGASSSLPPGRPQFPRGC